MAGYQDKIKHATDSKNLIRDLLEDLNISISNEDSFRVYINKLQDYLSNSDTLVGEEIISGARGIRAEDVPDFVENWTAVIDGSNLDWSNYSTLLKEKSKKLPQDLFISTFLAAPFNSTYLSFYNLDTNGLEQICTSAKGFLQDRKSLREVYFKNFVTPSNTSFRRLFSGCSSLQKVDFGDFDTSNVTDTSYMFYQCNSLVDAELEKLNTGSITSFRSMFNGCSSLGDLDLSNWNTSNVTSMREMFYNCSNIKNLNLSNWNTSKVTSFNLIFYYCSNLETLNISNWDFSGITSTSYLFSSSSESQASKLHTLILDNIKWGEVIQVIESLPSLITVSMNNWDTSNVKSLSNFFYGCTNITSLDLSNIDVTSQVTSLRYAFYGDKGLTYLNMNNWDTSGITDLNRFLGHCTNLATIVIADNFFSNPSLTSINHFANCNLTKETMFHIANKISDRSDRSIYPSTYQIYFRSSRKSLLTEEEQANLAAIFNSKNWSFGWTTVN